MDRSRPNPVLYMLAAFGAFLIMSLGGCIESRTLYFPSREEFLTPPGVEDVRIATPDGLTLHGWFMQAQGARPGERRPTVLHVHGNAGNVAGHGAFSSWLSARGFHVLVFDYRSYGRSSESPRPLRRDDLLSDARSALSYLVHRPDVDTDRIGVLGVSLGGVIGLALAAEDPRVRSVVSVAAFSSWKGVASDHASIVGWSLIPSGLDAVNSVRQLGTRPLLIVHGERDSIVLPRHAAILADAARKGSVNTSVVMLSKAGHNDILIDDQESQRVVADFLDRTLAR